MDVVAKLRERGKKDQPPKLLCDTEKWLKNVVTYFFLGGGGVGGGGEFGSVGRR